MTSVAGEGRSVEGGGKSVDGSQTNSKLEGRDGSDPQHPGPWLAGLMPSPWRDQSLGGGGADPSAARGAPWAPGRGPGGRRERSP